MAPTPNNLCQVAPFQVTGSEGRPCVVSVNLGNSLPTNTPGFDIATDILGDLQLVYFDQSKAGGVSLSNCVPIAKIPSYLGQMMKEHAGLVDLEVASSLLPRDVTKAAAEAAIQCMAPGIVGTVHTEKDSTTSASSTVTSTIRLAENENGYYTPQMRDLTGRMMQWRMRHERKGLTDYFQEFGSPVRRLVANPI
jgi:hypothetical protein